MRRLWLVGVVLAASSLLSQPSRAATTILYRGDATSLTSRPGVPVVGVPGVRQLRSAAQLSALTKTERRTAQVSVRYHTLFVPNDPQLALQWNLAMMNVAGAWDADTVSPVYGGDPKIVVAVLDTGLASTAVGAPQSVTDFSSSSIWTNTAEVPGDGIDNDQDGYIDDVAGWNFLANTPRPSDDNGHGTHIATTIAAQMNNGLATAGIASNVTIMPLKVLDQNGDGSTATLTAAVNYAVAHNVNIINLSLGGDQDDPLFHQAIQNAVAKGVVVIAAAGNSGIGTVTFPASYSEVISVGAVQVDRTKAPYANYGARLDLVAPGGNEKLDQNQDGQPDGILSSTCTDATCLHFASMYLVGTSQAAAQVSAVAALLESCGASAGTIRSVLTSTAQDLGAPGRDDVFGYGLIDAQAALAATGCSSAAPLAPDNLRATASVTAQTSLSTGRAYPYRNPSFTWSGQPGVTYAITLTRGGTTEVSQRQTVTSYKATISSEGEYVFQVQSVDGLGQLSEGARFTYRYQKPGILVGAGSTIRLLNSAFQPIRNIVTSQSKAGLRVSGGIFVNGQSNRLVLTSQPTGPTVTVTDAAGKKLSTFQPFGPKFTGGISTTVVHQADGQTQIVAATNSRGSTIAWYTPSGKKIGQNLVFAGDAGGVEIAAGDLSGDGNDELVVSQVVGPDIRVFSSQRQRITTLTPRGKTFRQGWSIAVGDTDGDGLAEILATPHIATANRKMLRLALDGRELGSWKVSGLPAAYPVVLQSADTNGDGLAEILVAPEQGQVTIERLNGAGKVLQKVTQPSTAKNSLGLL